MSPSSSSPSCHYHYVNDEKRQKERQREEDELYDEIGEILQVMRKQESGFYRCRDYLAPYKNNNNNQQQQLDLVDESWRQRMCEWMYGVVDHCNFRRDIVAVSATYLDLVLTKQQEQDDCRVPKLVQSRKQFQLAAMTCLYLAMKVYDTSFVKLESLSKLGRGLFESKDVVEMEHYIVSQCLGWRVHPPTAMCFLRHYTRILSSLTTTIVSPSCRGYHHHSIVSTTLLSPSTCYMISEVSRFIAEISVCLYKFVKYKPSAIAFAALVIAMDGIQLSSQQRKDIYDKLYQVAHVQQSDYIGLIRKLRASFEKNVDLNALMKTIDPHCNLVVRTTSDNYGPEETTTPKQSSSSKQRDHHDSPKDIITQAASVQRSAT